MIECVPTARLDVTRVAAPPLNVPLPIEAVPSLNVTVPVGVPVVVDLTVAVNVTAVPKVEGLKDDFTVVVLAPLVTVWVSAADVLPVKLPSPM